MKELILNNMEAIITVITIIITWGLGQLSKKSRFISNNLIPLQNFIIGLLVSLVEWYITGSFNIQIALSGLIAGGTYDIKHNLSKIKKEKQEQKEEDADLFLERDDEDEII